MNGSNEELDRIKSTIERLSQTFNAMAGLNESKDKNKREALIEQLKSEGKELNDILESTFPVANDKKEEEEKEKEKTSLNEETPNDNLVVVKIKKGKQLNSVANILTNVYEKATEMNSNSPNRNSTPQSNEVLVLRPSFVPIKIDPSLTVAVRLFGEKYRWLGEILVPGHPEWSKKWYIQAYGWLNLACTVVAFLALYKVLPPWFAFYPSIYFPISDIVTNILPLNWTLLQMLCSRFETLISLYGLTGYFLSCMILFSDWKMSVYFFSVLIACIPTLLNDARWNTSNRKERAKVELITLIIFDILIWYFGFFLNWFKLETIHEGFTFGILHFAWAAFGLSCWQTFIFFKLRIIYNGFRFPSNMVVLTSKLELQSMRESEAHVLIASSTASLTAATTENI